MKCLKGKTWGYVKDCFDCEHVYECVKVDPRANGLDPRLLAAAYKQLGLDVNPIQAELGWIAEESTTYIYNDFGTVMSTPNTNPSNFEDYMVSRHDELENKIEDFMRDLTLGAYKEHDICIVREVIESIEDVLDKHGIGKFCDPYVFYPEEPHSEHPCFEDNNPMCNREQCPFRTVEEQHGH